MNFKKLCMVASLFFLNQAHLESKETIVLTSPLLRVADNAGIFHAPILDILQTRIDIVNLIQGVKTWNGAIIDVQVADTNSTLTIYCRRPEIIAGAAFVAISPDHALAKTIATSEQAESVAAFMARIINNSLYDRQMSATNDAVFTGAYAVNPFTQDLLPIYISDYAIECFDMRHSNARLGFPAHNSKDFDFAHKHNLPINIVVDVQRTGHGKDENLDPVCAAPLLTKSGELTEAYLGEYSGCVITNSDSLNNLSLKDAAKIVIDYLVAHNRGRAHTEVLQYSHNNQSYSIKDLAKIETAVYKNASQSAQLAALKKDLKITLNYVHADFLEIVEKFIINVKDTKSLMIALITEDCEIRGINDCYLLRWSKLNEDNLDEKEIFRRDIVSMKELTVFCKDLVNFLGDFAHSCPKALQNIRNQN